MSDLVPRLTTPAAPILEPQVRRPVRTGPLRGRVRLATLLAVPLAAELVGCREQPPPAEPADRSAAAEVAPGEPRGSAGSDSTETGAAASEPIGGPPAALAATLAGALPDEAAARGLDYVNVSGEPAKATILEAGGAGVALLDLERDGDLDVVFGQGLASLAALVSGPGADLAVFTNDGTGHFTRAAGPGLSGWWTGLAAGDVDGDGDADLVAGGFGSLRVLLQDEDGRLVPGAELVDDPTRRLVPGEPRAAGHPPAWITSLALFDADRDGALDLYAGHYLDLDPLAPTVGAVGEGALAIPCRWKGLDVYCGPHGLVPQPDRLFRGRGDGTFEDRTATWLPGHVAGFTLAVGASDCDLDGDTDLYVANDSTSNLMLVNEIVPAEGDAAAQGAFVDFGFVSGVAVSQDGAAEAGMGVAWGDVNRDGRPDLAVTNFSDEPTALYFGASTGFANQTFRFGLNRATSPLLSWGVHLTDFDGDGWLDLFTANGHVYPQADAENTGTTYGQRDTLWSFGADHKVLAWPADDERSILFSSLPTRGSAVGDVDGDGRPDLVLARLDAPAALGIDRAGADAHWLEVRLAGAGPGETSGETPREHSGEHSGGTGPLTPRDAHGARVLCVPRVPSGTEPFGLVRELQTSGSYQSASSPWISFGLGPFAEFEELRVLWPSGRVEELGAGAAGRRLFVEEGRGIVRAEEL